MEKFNRNFNIQKTMSELQTINDMENEKKK